MDRAVSWLNLSLSGETGSYCLPICALSERLLAEVASTLSLSSYSCSDFVIYHLEYPSRCYCLGAQVASLSLFVCWGLVLVSCIWTDNFNEPFYTWWYCSRIIIVGQLSNQPIPSIRQKFSRTSAIGRSYELFIFNVIRSDAWLSQIRKKLECSLNKLIYWIC